jgi:hypothetical protein
MTEEMKKILDRAETMMCNHINDLIDEVDANGGHVKDHMTVDGVKDAVKTIKDSMKIKMMDGGKQPAATVSVVK